MFEYFSLSCNRTGFAGCRLPADDCQVTWPDVTSSIGLPAVADVITRGSGSPSPAWLPVGSKYYRDQLCRDDTKSPEPRPGTRLHDEVTSRSPRCAHVTSFASQPHPVGVDEYSIQSGGTSSSSAELGRPINSSSSQCRDVTDLETLPPPSALFPVPRLCHVTGSDLPAWLAGALRGRRTAGVIVPPVAAAAAAAVSPPLPLFRAQRAWPVPDLQRRRMSGEDAAVQLLTRPPTSLSALEVERRGISRLPLVLAAPGWPQLDAGFGTAAESTWLMTRERLAAEDRGLTGGDGSLFPDNHSTTALSSHVGGVRVSSATSHWTSPVANPSPRNILAQYQPGSVLLDLPHQLIQHYRHRYHQSYTGGQ